MTSSRCTGNCTAGYACPSGTSNSTKYPCPAGKYSLAAASSCTPCAAGRYGASWAMTTANCTGVCGVGYYCPVGSSVPLPCPPGTYSNASAAAACMLCPVATPYSPSGSASLGACVSCVAPLAGLANSSCTAGLVGRYPCRDSAWVAWVTDGIEPNNSCLFLNATGATWATHNASCAANGPGVHLLTSQQVVQQSDIDLCTAVDMGCGGQWESRRVSGRASL